MSAVVIPGTIRGRVGTVREIILGGAPASLKDHIENFPEKHPFLIRRFADVFKMPPNSLVTAAELNKGIDRIRADIIARVNPSGAKIRIAKPPVDASGRPLDESGNPIVPLGDPAPDAPKFTVEEHAIAHPEVPAWKHRSALAFAGWAEGKEVTSAEYQAAVEVLDSPDGPRIGGYVGARQAKR